LAKPHQKRLFYPFLNNYNYLKSDMFLGTIKIVSLFTLQHKGARSGPVEVGGSYKKFDRSAKKVYKPGLFSICP